MSKVENTSWKKTNIFTFGNFFFVGIFCLNLFLALSHCKKGIFFVSPKYVVCCTDIASAFNFINIIIDYMLKDSKIMFSLAVLVR